MDKKRNDRKKNQYVNGKKKDNKIGIIGEKTVKRRAGRFIPKEYVSDYLADQYQTAMQEMDTTRRNMKNLVEIRKEERERNYSNARKKFSESLAPLNSIDHEKAKESANKKVEQKKKDQILTLLNEYIKENKIDHMTVHTQYEGDKIQIQWINEQGEIRRKTFTLDELKKETREEEKNKE